MWGRADPVWGFASDDLLVAGYESGPIAHLLSEAEADVSESPNPSKTPRYLLVSPRLKASNQDFPRRPVAMVRWVRRSGVETAAWSRVETAAWSGVETATRSRVETATRSRVETATRSRVETAARSRVETTARSSVETAARSRVRSTARPGVEAAARSSVEATAWSSVRISRPHTFLPDSAFVTVCFVVHLSDSSKLHVTRLHEFPSNSPDAALGCSPRHFPQVVHVPEVVLRFDVALLGGHPVPAASCDVRPTPRQP